jgi:hypothetical protein
MPKIKYREAPEVMFENDIAVQKAMRRFSSASLAKVILHKRETNNAFKRNMVEGCWAEIQDWLDDEEFCETPESAFERFVKEYERHAKEAINEDC